MCFVRPSSRDYYSSDSYYAEDEESGNYYDDDDENYYSSSPSTSATSTGATTTTAQQETSSSSRRPYWEEPDDDYDYYPDDNNNDEDYTAALERDVPEWEKLPVPGAGTAWVLLPPASVAQPTAILHFVGGTFTGSAPNFWYRLFLEDIVRHTSTAIVATSIPVTLTRSPLQHVRLAQTLQRQFQAAYEAILVDEYGGGGSGQQRQQLRQVPICGLGHSLGARLLVVLATLLGGSNKTSSSSSPPALSYKSMILISFTNFGAAAGIPGLAQLFRHSRRSERRQQMGDEEEQQRTRDDLFDYDADRPPRRRRRKRRDDWLDEDDDDDGDWNDLFQELSATIQAGTARVQNALTPASSSLEFHPTPEQLWKALDKDEGGRYAIPQTLVVQFDDDEVDQSSQLATALVESSDVKFARIRGTHLTPVATTDGNDGDGNGGKAAWLQQVNSRAGRILLKGLQGRQRLRPRQKEESLRELRQSIARYITEVVTKE